MRVMLLGDTHGDVDFMLNHVIPAAQNENVDRIVQLGDFGYFDHFREVSEELDFLSAELQIAGLKMACIQGNHDNISYLMKNYGSNEVDWGFVQFRQAMYFILNGTRWEWGGKKFIALGGAYSIDKIHRLKVEAKTNWPQSQWFPEEEMSDADLDRILLNRDPVDVMLTHDAPSAANLGVDLKNIQECEPNRHRLQRAVRALQPKLLVHGHFHHRYETEIRCGDDGAHTRVIGLGANEPSVWSRASFKPSDAWIFLDL